jgi:predicted nucleic acid-binding protein
MPALTKVVDSWALVAWVQREPAAPLVRQFLLDADAGSIELAMSWLNVAETFYILAKRNSLSVAEESEPPAIPTDSGHPAG